ncbi:MAG TPA: MOSC domain-containing protein [Acidimicrobiia bacterium]|nr:MOSC domain-containing protein [Acidimicrobiia bacterium]
MASGINVGRVSQTWRYPAKSMMGSPQDFIDVFELGVLGDRAWAVRDEERGGIRGAKKINGLMGLAAEFVDGPTLDRPAPPIEITLPDGASVRSDDAAVNEVLSRALGRAVSLWPLRPADDLDHYRRGAPDSDDVVVELRAMFGRTEDEPLPDFSAFGHVLEYESPPGSYVDAYPLMLMTTRSMETLAARNPESRVDIRRFRPNVLVELDDHDGSPFPEIDWVGDELALGDAVLEVVAPCPRCVMVTLPFADLPRDRPLLASIVADADQNIGVYANVVVPGRITPGDSLAVLG